MTSSKRHHTPKKDPILKDSYIPKVSVILPVWNPGPGISRCIESLRNQTLGDIEMIFVDDRGTDDSMEKVRAAAAEDSRIRIIENEKNIGAGPSRNKGIEAARGEYLSFVDPDDYVAADFLELLYAEARKQHFDVVKGTRIFEKEDGEIPENNGSYNLTIRDGMKEGMPLYLLFRSEHQSAIYKKATILSTNARYGSSRRGQDTTFLLQICSRAKSFSTVDEAHYYFCERSDSAMHTLDKTRLEGSLQSVIEKVDYVLQNLTDDPWAMIFLGNYFIYTIRNGWRYRNISDMQESFDKFAKDLQSTWLRLPDREKLTSKSYSLRALEDHCCILPAKPYYYSWEGKNPPVRYANLAEHWIDFYIDNPNERKECLKELWLVLDNAKMAVQGYPASDYSFEERLKGKEILKKQIRRLPLKTRIKLTIKFRIVLPLSTSAKNRIKKMLNRL